MKNTIRILMTLSSLCLSLNATAAINARLDQDQVSPGETVQLILQHDGQTDSQPDLSPLKQDFDIVVKSSGSSIQIINGKMNSQVQMSLALMPKHSGKLTVPALQWDGQTSPVLTLTVSTAAAQPGNTSAAKSVFMTATLEQKEPYIQAAVPMTVRIYTDQPLYQAGLDFQPGKEVLVQQSGQDRQTSETRNGQNYQVIERKYLLFPQSSGQVHLPGPVLNAQVLDSKDTQGVDPFSGSIFGRNPLAGMLNTPRPIRIQADPVVLNVRPRPASAQGHDWLPAQNVSLTERWQPEQGQIHAGEPVTRHLHLSAEGLSAAQLPDLSSLMQLPAGLRAYPDQPKLDNDLSGNSITGSRDQDIAIIAGNAGHYEIPALHLYWWDTRKNIQQEVVLPARTLDVLPGSGGIAIGTSGQNPGVAQKPAPVSSAPEQPDNKAKLRWDYISLGLALLWLGTLLSWWLSGRRKSKGSATLPAAPVAVPRITEARKAFWKSCQENDARAARRHLLAWAQASWPEHAPAGLNALADRLEDASITPLLKQLDRACYGDEQWQGAALMKSLRTLPDRPVVQPLATQLSGLYP